MTPAATLHVVDDDPAIRDSLRLLLESAGFVVRTYDGAASLLAASPQAGCVLTDLRMPGIDGLELQRRLNRRLPVILMTAHADVPLAVRAMRAGALDFLEKPFTDDQLLTAVTRAVEEGRRVEAAAARLAALTPRERQVLDLLVAGLPNKAIAANLGASPRTIEVHRARILEKLCVHSLPELVRLTLAATPVRPQTP